MEFLKKAVQLICLYTQDFDEKEPVDLSQFLCGKKNTIAGTSQESAIIKLICFNLPREMLPPRVSWIKEINNRKILLLDLDKTLIYFSNCQLQIRPYLDQFLTAIKKWYQIYIFTSATQSYANQILKQLKQQISEHKSIKGVLARQHCIKVKRENSKIGYIKDLRILSQCQLRNVIIVDDNPLSYCLNQKNAIPIKPFEGERTDNQLKLIITNLLNAAKCDDVRDYLTANNQYHNEIRK